MSRESIIKKLESRGYSAKEEDNLLYVDLLNESDIKNGLEKLRNIFREFGYNKSFGVRYKNER